MADSLIQKKIQAASGGLGGPRVALTPAEAVDAERLDAIRKKLYEKIPADLLARRTDPEAQRAIEAMIRETVASESGGRLSRPAVIRELRDDLLGYGPIQSLIDDPEVTEVMVNRYDTVYYEKGGVIHRSDIRFRDHEHVRNVIEKIVGPVGRRIDESSPMVDARLPDGSRVNAVIPPIARDGPCITIRKFGRSLSPEELVSLGTVTEEALRFLGLCVEGRLNVMVSGGTGSGKTTFLNALSSFIPPEQRIITVEDVAELQLQQPHVVRLESRPPNIEGKGEIPIRALVRNALRMRPDRIIVGEVRGGEALDMLQAMNTGHAGSMTTLHANSPADAVRRLEVMVLMAGEDLPHAAVREQIASALDLIVHTERLRDGRRAVVAVSEVSGISGGEVVIRDLYLWSGSALEPTGAEPGFKEKLLRAGVDLEGGGEG